MCQAVPEGEVARLPQSWHVVHERSQHVTTHTAILGQVLPQTDYIRGGRTTSRA